MASERINPLIRNHERCTLRGTSTVSFQDAAINGGIEYNHLIDGIQHFVDEILPTCKDRGYTDVITLIGDGPWYGIWFYVLTDQNYGGIIINYFKECRTARFTFDRGNYTLVEIQ